MASKRAESRARYFVRKTLQSKGWNINHLEDGGDLLEEQEVISYFPGIGLGAKRPDFLVCLNGNPAIVIETKNDFKKYNSAIDEAIEYCEIINSTQRYNVHIAIGVAGEDKSGYIVKIKYLKDGIWTLLTSRDNEVTALLSKTECANAIQADNSTLTVEIPSSGEFIDAAIEMSKVLRQAKIEPSLRPKVVGAVTTALYKGEIDLLTEDPLSEINRLLSQTIRDSQHLTEKKKQRLIEAVTLTGGDYDRLSPYINRIVSILQRLNVRVVLQSDADFLGMFYEAFLRYGSDNNAMGIVFTPRHITRFCIDLTGVEIGQKIIDITCGTGGFLVSAFDKLKGQATSESSLEQIRNSIFGYDTNPTVWALSCLNMFFRGDGRSHIENLSSLSEEARNNVYMQCHRAFLNPPFHQEGEPERDFIDASMDALCQGGLFAGVVYAGMFADEDNAIWRDSFLHKHTLLGMISLPDDLFYPTSAPTSIIIARAHVPQPKESCVFMAKIWNDGYEKLKGKRVHCSGSQIPAVLEAFSKFMKGERYDYNHAVSINASKLFGGQEFSPQQWLPRETVQIERYNEENHKTLFALFQAITNYPDITDCLTKEFEETYPEDMKPLPIGEVKPLSYFFHIVTGNSKGEKNYSQGVCPYVSSGDDINGVIRLVNEADDEICNGCITVSAFGTAYLQPWKFMARGNGGSAVRVLRPKYRMSTRELFWFVAQINSQRWRFSYARMAIKSRLERLEVESPHQSLDRPVNLINKLKKFKESLMEHSNL